MKKIRRLQGFTLIELMLVIALTAMLIGFTVPSYQKYLIRTQVAEGFVLAAPMQAAVTEFFYETGVAPNHLGAIGFERPPQGRYIKTISIRNGVIVIEYGNQANTQLANKILRLTPYLNPDQTLVWRCQNGALPPDAMPLSGVQFELSDGDIPSGFLAQSCRKNEAS